jgi:hypothetical protein
MTDQNNQPTTRGSVAEPVLRMVKRFGFLLLLFLILPVVQKETEAQAAGISPLVIGVAEWRYEGGAVLDVQANAYESLLAELEPLGLEQVTIVKIPATLATAMDTDAVAAEFDVDMILWGWYDDVAVRSYVDLANATQEDGLTNSLDAFLRHGGSTQAIRVLKVLSSFDYYETGLYFCVPRWTP